LIDKLGRGEVVLGHVIIGMVLGMISAAISLFLGSSLLWALVMYSVVGGLGILLSAAIVYALSRFSERGSLIKTCKWFLRGD
jgi:Zn-dependent protease with chaperone function